jgi:hypothetical protein
MKKLKQGICLTALSTLLLCASCGKEKSADGDSGSDSQTTANDSSGAVSRKALGTDEGKQKEMSGYPSNQSNLNSDSTSKRHDVDTIKKPAKDKPNKHL